MQLKPFCFLGVWVCSVHRITRPFSDSSKYNYSIAQRDVCVCERACVILSYLVVLCAYDMNRVMWFLCTYSLLLLSLLVSLMNNKMSKHNLTTLNRWHFTHLHSPFVQSPFYVVFSFHGLLLSLSIRFSARTQSLHLWCCHQLRNNFH